MAQALGLLLLTLTIAAPTTLAADSDNDGLSDGFETRFGVTSPNLRDSDWDGVVDSAEDSDGEVDAEDIHCAGCGGGEANDDDDILLCDGFCDRGVWSYA